MFCVVGIDLPHNFLRYRWVNVDVFMDASFADEKETKSLRHNICAQMIVSDCNFVYIVPMKKKSHVHSTLKHFFKFVGVLPAIICDVAPEQVKGEARKLCQNVNTR